MITVDCGEFNTDGIADFGEAIALAKKQGIANARGAIHEDILWNLHSLGTMAWMGMVREVPGVINRIEASGLGAYALNADALPAPASKLIFDTEKAIIKVAGSELPNWKPSSRIPGVRMVTMQANSRFYPHTDDYEGLVASLQWFVEGEKRIQANINDVWVDEPIGHGDITFFAGDTFSQKSRRFHGFTFEGQFAAAFTLGQDPYYTISGNFPFATEHPEYGFDIPR